jgi:voltage-gated potassium channel Kch
MVIGDATQEGVLEAAKVGRGRALLAPGISPRS